MKLSGHVIWFGANLPFSLQTHSLVISVPQLNFMLHMLVSEEYILT